MTGTQGAQGLQGTVGAQGATGLAFTIAKTYVSVAALTADTYPTSIIAGQFALINTADVEDPENSKLYLWNGSSYIFVDDLSGSAGIQGITGSQGVTGIQGALGVQGSAGPQGIQGLQGIAGSQGTLGTQGAAGSQGIQGITGSQGTQGIQGLQGIQGAAGFVGSNGAQGAQGIQGIQGITGSQGINGSNGAQGAQGIQGIQGLQGTQGIQGLKGTKITPADTAPASPSENDLWWDSTNGILMVYYNDGTSSQWVSANSGIAGAQGVQGVQGITGSQGTQGIQGLQGVQGIQGVQGTQGVQGVQGITGLAFTIAKTYASVAALTADTAPTGIVAGQFALINTSDVQNSENSRLYIWTGSAYTFVDDLSGAAGIQGITGSQGITGAQGVQGIQGTQGTQGLQGITGAQGISGAQGVQGIQGIQGTQGTQGLQGITGAQGISGASILGLNNTFTGVNSININGTVGATTANTGAFTTLSASATSNTPITMVTTNAISQLSLDTTAGGATDATQIAFRRNGTSKWTVGNNVVNTGDAFTIASAGVSYVSVSSTGLAVTGALSSTTKLTAGTLFAQTPGVAGSFSCATPTFASGQGTVSIGSTDSVAVDKGGIITFNANTTTLSGFPVAAIAGKTEAVGAGVYSGYLQFVVSNPAGTTAERMRIDSSGNVGIGVTPSAWDTDRKVLQLGTAANINGSATATSFVEVSGNTFTGTGPTDRYINTAAASKYRQNAGAHSWYTAASGTAGNTITFTQSMTLDSTGLAVTGALSATGTTTLGIGGTASANSGDLFISGSGASAYGPLIGFKRNGSDIAYITTVGRLASTASSDLAIFSTSNVAIYASSASVCIFDLSRTTIMGALELNYSGGIATVQGYDRTGAAYKTLNLSGSTVAMIVNGGGTATFTTSGMYTAVGTANGLIGFGGITASYPAIRYNSGTEVGFVLADQSAYCATRASAFNVSSDIRIKTNIRNFSESGAMIDAIIPRIFDMDTSKKMHENGKTNQIGFIAQELYPVFEQAVTKGDDNEEITEEWGVDYSKLVPILVAELQSLRQRVAALESK